MSMSKIKQGQLSLVWGRGKKRFKNYKLPSQEPFKQEGRKCINDGNYSTMTCKLFMHSNVNMTS
jgi:hypothetical protein